MAYVYFFRETGREFVKIGMTDADDVKNRFISFKTYAPLGAYIAGVIKTSNAKGLEKEIHEEYMYKRKQGEFFEMTDAEVEMLVNRHDSNKNGKLASAINEWLASNEYNEEGLIKLIKSDLQKTEVSAPNRDAVLDVIKTLSGEELTNTEILAIVKNSGIDATQSELGRILKEEGYKHKAKKVRRPYSSVATVKRIYAL